MGVISRQTPFIHFFVFELSLKR